MIEYRGYGNAYRYKTSTILSPHFVIDNSTAVMIRQMFLWTLDSKNIDEIAEYLNQQSYLTPSEYARCDNMIMRDKERSGQSPGDSRMVRRILKDRTYIGTLEWGYWESYYEEGGRKQRKISITQGGSDRKLHSPIVIMDEFMRVRMILDIYSGVREEQTYISL